MSRVSVTMCDCCRKEITGKPNEPNLALVVCMPKTKITVHFCVECATPLIETMNLMMEKRE